MRVAAFVLQGLEAPYEAQPGTNMAKPCRFVWQYSRGTYVPVAKGQAERSSKLIKLVKANCL